MNKYDIYLVLFVLIVSCLLLIFVNRNSSNYAYVYYDNKEVLKIDLSKDDNYKVEGFNGEVLIEVKGNKLRVFESFSGIGSQRIALDLLTFPYKQFIGFHTLLRHRIIDDSLFLILA